MKTTAHNMSFAKMAGDVVLEIFLHLTTVCARRQLSAFHPPSSQSAKRYGQAMKTTLLLSLLINLLSSCNDIQRQKSESHQSQFTLTDKVVLEIKEGMQGRKFLKHELSHMSQFGGYVYELLKQGESRVFLYSNFGGEAGSTELECYYSDGQPIFAVYRKYTFESKNHEYDPEKAHLTFEQVNYIAENRLLKKTITKHIENKLWSSKDIPSDVELMNKINGIHRELAEEKIASP